MNYFPRVFRYLRPYWKLAVLSVGLIILGALAGLLTPWPLMILIDYVLLDHQLPSTVKTLLGPVSESKHALLIVVVIGGVLVTILQHALTVLDNYVNTRIDLNVVLDFRCDLFRHAERLSLAYHDQRRAGMLIFAINNQGDSAARLIMIVPALAQSALMLIGMFVVLWIKTQWQLALLSLIVVPFLYKSIGYYAKYIQERLFVVRGMEGESLSIIHEAINMMRVIITFGREDYEYQRFRKQGERTMKSRINLTMRQTIFSLTVDTITACGTAVVLGYTATQILSHALTIGDLTLILAYLASVYKPLETISHTIGSLQEVLMHLRVSFNLLDTEPDIKDAPDAIEIPRITGDVRFEQVNFAYGGRVATLKSISFEGKAGQVIGIVGATGAGKSTLVSLIPRLYEAKQGDILLDGHDIRRLKLKSLREQISVVLQEPLLFSGSIAQNIRYGRLDANDEEVIEAARAANAHDFIMKLPQQYETEIGERGMKLSGGERQRIAVARAFIKDSPVLILDEPTSSIDSKTEAVILDALDRLMVGRTTFIIAHRLSTIRRADYILVLDEGEIVERGTHDDLIRLGGVYQRLYEIQNTTPEHHRQNRESNGYSECGLDEVETVNER